MVNSAPAIMPMFAGHFERKIDDKQRIQLPKYYYSFLCQRQGLEPGARPVLYLRVVSNQEERYIQLTDNKTLQELGWLIFTENEFMPARLSSTHTLNGRKWAKRPVSERKVYDRLTLEKRLGIFNAGAIVMVCGCGDYFEIHLYKEK